MRREIVATVALLAVVGLFALGCQDCESAIDCQLGQVCQNGSCVPSNPYDDLGGGDGGGWDTEWDGGGDTDTGSDTDTGESYQVQWIPIEGGAFDMGSENAGNAQPVREVTVPSFDMTKSEVTCAQYAMCINDGVCIEDFDNYATNWDNPNRLNHPMNGVSLSKAMDFCDWVGGRIPSEAEWEYAARSEGQDNDYPWGGDDPDCSLAVMDDGGSGCTEGHMWAVCTKPAGNTEQGLCDMAGNAWEWTLDAYAADYEEAPIDGSPYEDEFAASNTLRGGGYVEEADGLLHTYDRVAWPNYDYATDLGFRCVRDPE